MDKRKEVHRKMEESLSLCESRLAELKGKAGDEDRARELGEIEQKLTACRLELDQLEGKSGDEWVEAKHGVIRKLEDVQRNLQLSPRRMEDFIR